MDIFTIIDQYKAYVKLTNAWLHADCLGIICSDVNRINCVVTHLAKLGVIDLIPYLLIDEKTKAFVYKADLWRNIVKHEKKLTPHDSNTTLPDRKGWVAQPLRSTARPNNYGLYIGLINVVEIYHDWNPRSTEWRKREAKFALQQLDEDLIDGLDDRVAIPKLVVPFAHTAMQEVMLIY